MSAGEGEITASGEGEIAAGGEGEIAAGGEGEIAARGEDGRSPAVCAGRVGRAHGLDGSFYVTGARPRLLAVGIAVMLADLTDTIVRRAGTDEHPIVRLRQVTDRLAAEALRGRELTVEIAMAPALDEGEWWAHELDGCEVVDGERHLGTVVGLLELPSCEALEVRLDPASLADAEGSSEVAGSADAEGSGGATGSSGGAGSLEMSGSGRASRGARRASGGELLVPMVRDAIRHVDPLARRIDVDMDFLGGA